MMHMHPNSSRTVLQDESTGLVVSVLDPHPGDRILDGCAAPGGKALLAAARMDGKASNRLWICILLVFIAFSLILVACRERLLLVM